MVDYSTAAPGIHLEEITPAGPISGTGTSVAALIGIPAKPVARRRPSNDSHPAFQPYALGPEIPDPIARALTGLLDEVTGLRARLAELERIELAGSGTNGPALDLHRSNMAGDKESVA